MKILFVSREYPPETGGGGIGSYVETIAAALASRGHEVHVLSCAHELAREDSIRAGVQVHQRGVRRLLPKVKRLIPRTAGRIEGAVTSYLEARGLPQPDVVEAPDWLGEGLVFALLGSRPLVVHLHTPLFLIGRHEPKLFSASRDGRLAARIERFTVRRADLVTSPSRLLARDIERAGWLRDRRVEIVRYPVDLEPWSGRDSADIAPPRVLVVGRLEARKAPEIVIRAAALLSSEVAGLEVVFIGRSSLRNGGSYREWLADLAAEVGVACRFIEHVDRVRMPEWYSRARAVVVASRYDNFPYAGLEAMASARPLVCSRSTGMAEILDGSRGGVVVDVDDHRAIATALRPYMLDGAVAARAGREARELVERVCSPDRIAEEREACFQEAIARWTRRQGRNARQQGGG